MPDTLDFEKSIQELETKLLELRRSRPDDREEIERLATRLPRLMRSTSFSCSLMTSSSFTVIACTRTIRPSSAGLRALKADPPS